MAAQLVNKGVEAPPQSRGGGFWIKQLNEEWKQNPGVGYEYIGVSSSTSSNLRRDHGVDATTRTITNENGEQEVHLYVKYNPDEVDAIKGEYPPRPPKKAKKSAVTENGAKTDKAPAKV